MWLCANNGRRTPRWVLNACRRSSRLCFSHFATHTVDNTVELYAAKPDIRPESRFLPKPPAFDTPVREFPSEYRYTVWYGATRWWKKVDDVYSFWHNSRTWQTDGQTWRQRPRLMARQRAVVPGIMDLLRALHYCRYAILIIRHILFWFWPKIKTHDLLICKCLMMIAVAVFSVILQTNEQTNKHMRPTQYLDSCRRSEVVTQKPGRNKSKVK